jgi:hypothetical protein
VEVTAILVSSCVWECKLGLEIGDGELRMFGGVAENIELPVVC